ncbi:MAG: hypothetical protein JWP63_6997 [Candidatus Solibacter sp.]|nr:hypothetical protein [Candidatus Solibacter sp.]
MRICARILIVAVMAANTLLAETWSGILVDSMCHAKDVQGHTRACAMSDRCAGSGFGLVLRDDQFLKFDDASNKKALAALKASTMEEILKAKVTGTRKGDIITVDSIELQ